MSKTPRAMPALTASPLPAGATAGQAPGRSAPRVEAVRDRVTPAADRALPLYAEFVAARRRFLGADSQPFADLLAKVGRDLLALRQYPAAEAYLRECLAILRVKLPDDWGAFDAQSMLGAAVAGQGRYAEAEPLLACGYHGLERRRDGLPPADDDRLTEAVDRLVRLYDAWIKPADAARWRAERAKYPTPYGKAPTPRG